MMSMLQNKSESLKVFEAMIFIGIVDTNYMYILRSLLIV